MFQIKKIPAYFLSLLSVLFSLSTAYASTNLSISSIPNPAQAGNDLQYHIQFSQGTAQPCRNATLTLNLPANTTFKSSFPAGTHSGNTVTWSLPFFHNEVGSRWATVAVDSGLPDGAILNVSATIVGSNCSANTLVQTVVKPAPAPILTLNKTASKTHVNAGGQLVYTLHYENTGTGDATGVVVKDQLPADVTFKSATGGGTEAGGIVTWNLGTLAAGAPPGSMTVTVDVKSPLANGTVLHNNSSIVSNETAETAAPEVDVIVDSGPVLTLDKTASKTHVNAGGQVVYTLEYHNIGTDQATGVVLTDQLPADVTFKSATGGGMESNGIVTWNLGSLGAGQSGSVNVTVDVDSPLPDQTILDNNASIDSNETAPVASPEVDVTVDSTPVLTLRKTASKTTVNAGDQLVYNLHYQNTGSDQASNVVLTDQLPANVQFISASGGGKESGGIVTWNLGTLAAGVPEGSVSVTVKVNDPLADGTRLHNTSSIVSTETSNSPETAFIDVSVHSAPVLITAKIPRKFTVKPGDQLVYTLSYQNVGSDQATGVTLEDHLPADVTFVSATGGGTESGGIVTWNLGTLAAGSPLGSVTVTVEVNSPLANGTLLVNTSTIDSDQTAPVSAPSTGVHVQSLPSLTLEKTASKVTVNAGDQLVYTLHYHNEGTAQANNVVLEDHLPNDVAFKSATGGGTESSGIVTWNLGTLAAGASGSVSVTVDVDSPIADGTVLHNASSIDSDQTSPVSAPVVDTTVHSIANLTLNKTASSSQVNAGDPLVYTLHYQNNGTDQATGVVIEDHLPAQVTFQSATGGGTESGGIVTWNLGSLAAGASGSVTVTVQVASPIANGTVLHNTSTIDSTQTSPVSAPVVDVTVNSQPALVIAKTASKPIVNAGEQLSYTIQFQNSGSDQATDVVIEDHLPANVTFHAATGGGSESGGIVTWNLGALAAAASGSVTVTVAVDDPIANGTVLHNNASIDSSQTSPVSAPVVDVTVTSLPVLGLKKTASQPIVAAGDQLVYTLNYQNIGSDQATNIVLEDHLPADVSFNSASAGGTESNGIVTWNLGTLAAGASGSVTVSVVVASPIANGTVLHNSSVISSSETPPFSAPVVDVTATSQPAFILEKTASKATVDAGGQLVYTLNYQNIGSDQATDVILEDHLPANVTFDSASAGGAESGGIVSWNLGTVAAGASGSVTVSVDVNSPLPNGTGLLNLATIQSSQTPPLSAFSATTVSSAPQLILTKLASKPIIHAGGQLVYTIQFENNGTDQATNVTLEDILPGGVTFSSASAGGTESSGVVSWNIGTLAAGAQGSVTLTVDVDSLLPDGTGLLNITTIQSSQTPPLSAFANTTVSNAPLLSLDKLSSSSTIKAGNQLVYTLNYQNTGIDQAVNAVLEDLLPANTSFVSASGGGTISNGVITWNLGDLPPGLPGSVTMTVAVDSPLTDGTGILNAASLQSAQTPPISAFASSIVSSAPVLSVDKTASKSTVSPGESFTYTLNYQNTGSDQATNAILQDLLPGDVSFVSASNGGAEAGGVVTWNLGTIAAGASGSVTVTVAAKSPLANGTLLQNSGSIDSTETSPVSSPIVNVNVSSAPVLTIEKSASKNNVKAGEELTYTLNYQNTGSDQATNVILQDTLPANTTFKSATDGGTEAGGIVTWNLGTLAAGAMGSVSMTVTVDSPLNNGTVLDNTASILSPVTPPVSSPVVGTTVTSLPILTLEKTASTNPVNAGSQLTYTLNFENIGNSPATNVILTDELPAGTTPVSSSPAGSVSGSKISWNLGTLNPGAYGTIMVTVLVNQSLSNGSMLPNSASISSPDTNSVSTAQTVSVKAPTNRKEARPIPTIGFLAKILLTFLLLAIGRFGLTRRS